MSYESDIFDWVDYEIYDSDVYLFLGCTLKRDIGRFKEGDFVGAIIIDFENMLLKIYTEEDFETDTISAMFPLRLEILPEIASNIKEFSYSSGLGFRL